MTKRDPYAAANASKRIEAIADLVRDGQVGRRDGARRIRDAFNEFMGAISAGSPAGEAEACRVTYGLGVGLQAALSELERRGPVVVRYIDGDALVTWLMPDGPPDGMGG